MTTQSEPAPADRNARRGFSLPLTLPLRFDSAPKIERDAAAKTHPTSDAEASLEP